MMIYNLVKQHRISKGLFISYFALAAMGLYFTTHAIFGSKGLIQYFALKSQIRTKENIKEQLLVKMKTKENLVKGMDPNSIDLDLLDEQVRSVLGYSNRSETVIYTRSN